MDKNLRSERRTQALGLLVCGIAAVLWGSAGATGQYLISMNGVDSLWLTSFRTFVGGALFVLFIIATEGRRAFRIWRDAKDALRLIVFGIVGLALVYWTYFETVALSSAPTATTLQYLSPLMIMGYTAVRERRLPTAREVLALAFALAGVFVMATHLDLGTLAISPQALAMGTLSAAALAFYGVYPRPLLRKYGTVYVFGWALLVSGVFMLLFAQPWNVPEHVIEVMNPELAAVLAWSLLVGTMTAYCLYLVGVSIVGPTRGSLVSSIEPVATAFIVLLWLGTPIEPLDWVGMALITVTVVIVSLPSRSRSD